MYPLSPARGIGLPACLLAVSLLCAHPGAAETRRVHIVRGGQTLWSLGYHYGVKVEELMQLNGITDPSQLLAGQSLRIPSSGKRRPKVRRPTSIATLLWPLRGQITSRYGRRGRRRHTGLDIAATHGTIIVAADDGIIVRAGDRWGRYGKVVLIEHDDGRKTLYAHVSRSFVGRSERVRRGQAIAAVGATGNATGPHLHFELWLGDRAVDPARWLRKPVTRSAYFR